MYWQYTTALACSVLAAMNPVTSSADSVIESFILASRSCWCATISWANSIHHIFVAGQSVVYCPKGQYGPALVAPDHSANPCMTSGKGPLRAGRRLGTNDGREGRSNVHRLD